MTTHTKKKLYRVIHLTVDRLNVPCTKLAHSENENWHNTGYTLHGNKHGLILFIKITNIMLTYRGDSMGSIEPPNSYSHAHLVPTRTTIKMQATCM